MESGFQMMARPAPTLPPHAPMLALTARGVTGTPVCQTGQPVTLIGARPDCHLSLDHPDVSRVHCALVNTGKGLTVCDLRSRMGTFVNGKRVTVAALSPGDTLRVGPIAVEVRFSDGAKATPAAQVFPRQDATRLKAPARLASGGLNFEVGVSPAVIGRRNNCDVVLDTPDVSLAHALLFTLDGCPAIFDLGSRSGTMVNGERTPIAWLRDGDRIVIGGEELKLEWSGPTALSPPPAEPTAFTEPVEPPPAKVENEGNQTVSTAPQSNGFELLEQTIQILQQQLNELRDQLEQRAASLEEKASELETLSTLLQEERTRLDAQSAELTSRSAASDQARAELEQQQAALQAAQQAYDKNRAEVDQLRGECEARAQQIQADQKRLATERETLDRCQAEYNEVASTIHQREAAVAERLQALDIREQTLVERETKLANREAAEAEATRKIAMFKSALQEASALFQGMEGGAAQAAAAMLQQHAVQQAQADASAAAPPPAQPQPAPTAPKSRPADSPGKAAGSKGKAIASVAAGAAGTKPQQPKADLPGPVVAEPMFAGGKEDLPPEVRERFRLLRRMSNKSDEELLSQVMEEHKSKHSEAGDPNGDKRKKRWWS